MIQHISSVCCRAAAHPAELAGQTGSFMSLLPAIASEPLERGAQQTLDVVATHVGAGGAHGIARFSFTKAEVSQASNRVGHDIYLARAALTREWLAHWVSSLPLAIAACDRRMRPLGVSTPKRSRAGLAGTAQA
jgi:hypothetical protein